MQRCPEFDKGWKMSLELDILDAEQKRNQAQGKYAEARRKRTAARIAAIKNYLSHSGKVKASTWRRPVFNAAMAAFRADEQLPFKELLDDVMKVEGVPDEEAVRRFLNQKGFKGKSGRPKK